MGIHKADEELTPMERFIADWEPAGTDAEEFRKLLADAINASVAEALAKAVKRAVLPFFTQVQTTQMSVPHNTSITLPPSGGQKDGQQILLNELALRKRMTTAQAVALLGKHGPSTLLALARGGRVRTIKRGLYGHKY